MQAGQTSRVLFRLFRVNTGEEGTRTFLSAVRVHEYTQCLSYCKLVVTEESFQGLSIQLRVTNDRTHHGTCEDIYHLLFEDRHTRHLVLADK